MWAVLDGHGAVTANGRTFAVDHPGCYELIEHERSTDGELRSTSARASAATRSASRPGWRT